MNATDKADMKQADQNEMLATILASTIHEIKNGFNALLAEIEHLTEALDGQEKFKDNITHIQTESFYISHQLNQMLNCYKNSDNQIPINIQHQMVDDFLEELCFRHQTTTAHTYHCKIEFSCDEDVTGFFDEHLMANVIDTAIYNAAREDTVNHIALHSDHKDGMLCFEIQDNGPGFPTDLLASINQQSLNKTENAIDQAHCKTGLGLHFASLILALHQNKDTTGKVTAENNDQGACLRLWLPV